MGSRSAGEGTGGPEDWFAVFAWLVFRRFFGMLGADREAGPPPPGPPPGGPSRMGFATEFGGGGLKSGGQSPPGIR